MGRRAAGYRPGPASGQTGGQGIAEGHLFSLRPCQLGRVGRASAILGSEGKRSLFTAVPPCPPPRLSWEGLGDLGLSPPDPSHPGSVCHLHRGSCWVFFWKTRQV